MNNINSLCTGCKKVMRILSISTGSTKSPGIKEKLQCMWFIREADKCPCSQCLIKSICRDICEQTARVIKCP